MRGVFATRSPDRPNPIGLHRVEIVEMPEPTRIRVRPLEVVDGTPSSTSNRSWAKSMSGEDDGGGHQTG